ncbi:hypothetical protein ABZ402_52390 [Streptomyces mirabilis]|uniref:SbtR family transcriptional regulator n=1 Tax=Streptomyces mirabilis TaxID=68239 RepID=UPI0033E579F6
MSASRARVAERRRSGRHPANRRALPPTSADDVIGKGSVLPRTEELTTTLDALAGQLLDRTRTAGAAHGAVTWEDLLPLMCGIAFAANLHADERQARLESGRRYLEVMLRGLRG